jgi:hypothetical protein
MPGTMVFKEVTHLKLRENRVSRHHLETMTLFQFRKVLLDVILTFFPLALLPTTP